MKTRGPMCRCHRNEFRHVLGALFGRMRAAAVEAALGGRGIDGAARFAAGHRPARAITAQAWDGGDEFGGVRVARRAK